MHAVTPMMFVVLRDDSFYGARPIGLRGTHDGLCRCRDVPMTSLRQTAEGINYAALESFGHDS